MLPDLPNLKKDIQSVLTKYLQKQVRERLGIFGEVPRHTAHEGNRMRMIRADGSVDDSEFKETSGELTLNIGEVAHLTIEDRLAKLNDISDEMARDMSKHLFESLNTVLDKSGQVVDRKGKPLNADSILDVMEKLEVEFDQTGKHNEISIVIPTALIDRAKHAFNQLESDPVLKKKYKEIMEKKRLDWRDREADRKLVG